VLILALDTAGVEKTNISYISFLNKKNSKAVPYDETGSGKSKMAASTLEIHVSQLVHKMAINRRLSDRKLINLY